MMRYGEVYIPAGWVYGHRRGIGAVRLLTRARTWAIYFLGRLGLFLGSGKRSLSPPPP